MFDKSQKMDAVDLEFRKLGIEKKQPDGFYKGESKYGVFYEYVGPRICRPKTRMYLFISEDGIEAYTSGFNKEGCHNSLAITATVAKLAARKYNKMKGKYNWS